MRKIRATPVMHLALVQRCPFCHADPGEACRTHRGRGVDLDVPHARRIALVDPWIQKRNEPKPPQQALCCECGQLRTVSANFNFSSSDPNRAQGYGEFTDQRGWRLTGTLKCCNCGVKTRHAIIRTDQHRDYTERVQRFVLGGKWGDKYEPDLERLRDEYFAQLPRNPNLKHRFVMAEADELRAKGETHMRAVCGAVAKIPRSWRTATSSPGDLVEPDRIDWETEFEDPETGLWWVDMECVDCLRVSNERRLARRRERLKELIDWYVDSHRKQIFTHAEVESLIEFLETVGVAAFERWQEQKERQKLREQGTL